MQYEKCMEGVKNAMSGKERIALSIAEAAQWTGIGTNTLRQLITWKKLPAVYVGNKIVGRIADLEYFLQENLGKNLRDQNDVISCDAVRI